MQNNNENNHANEPLPNYGKDIVFFKSFEEMNQFLGPKCHDTLYLL